jgi:geranylgeranyl diphosphate synthase type II
VVAGGGTLEQFAVAGQYAGSIGLAFQVRDDILDCIGAQEELGKPIGSDLENKKTTTASLLGIAECEAMCKSLTESAISAVEYGFGKSEFLKALAYYLVDRKN